MLALHNDIALEQWFAELIIHADLNRQPSLRSIVITLNVPFSPLAKNIVQIKRKYTQHRERNIREIYIYITDEWLKEEERISVIIF